MEQTKEWRKWGKELLGCEKLLTRKENDAATSGWSEKRSSIEDKWKFYSHMCKMCNCRERQLHEEQKERRKAVNLAKLTEEDYILSYTTMLE